MPSSSTYYNLTLYSSAETTELFLDFRDDQAGTVNSNMMKIDTALNDIQTEIDAISSGARLANGIYSAGSLYNATVSGITAYEADMQIILKLDTTSNGTVTLDINTLGVKAVYKIDNDGNVQNIDGNELGKNREYLARYTGTAWVIVSAIQNASVLKKNTEALSTTLTLTNYSSTIQYLDANGADRDVFLPAEGEYNPLFIIHNNGSANVLNVQDDAGTDFDLVVSPGQVAYVFSDGTNWEGFINYIPGEASVGSIQYWSSATQIANLTPPTAIGKYLRSTGVGTFSWGTFGIDDDASPTLGGNLDTGGYSISDSVGSVTIGDALDVTGNISLNKNDGDFTIVSESGVPLNALYSYSSSFSYDGATFSGYRARNTLASPQAVNSGDRLTLVSGVGHDGTTFTQANAILFRAGENWTGTNKGGDIIIQSNLNGTATNVAFVNFLGSGETVFNQDANDINFRIEGTTNQYLMVADAGSDLIRIGANTGGFGALNVIGSSGSTSVYFVDQATASTSNIVQQAFSLENSVGGEHIYGAIRVQPKNVTDGTETGSIQLRVGISGGATETMLLVDDNGVKSYDALGFAERSSDPSDPAEGNAIIWQSDGTGTGDDGDIMIKITAGATTKTTTLVDFSTI